jgi:hypothetical protein
MSGMSAFANSSNEHTDVACWHKADIAERSTNVRFWW